MPAITLPVSFFLSKTLKVIQHDTADDFLNAAYSTLRRHEQSSNIILAHALQRSESALVDSETTKLSDENLKSSSSFPHSTDSFWLTVWSSTSASTLPALDLTLSCIKSTLGNYPIFLWSPRQPSAMSLTWLAPRVIQLMRHLDACVPRGRVFSVFGKTLLAKEFSRHWIMLTGCSLEPEPFYAAYYTFCTPESLRDSDHPLSVKHCIRQATIGDLDHISQLCKEFADCSVSAVRYRRVFSLRCKIDSLDFFSIDYPQRTH